MDDEETVDALVFTATEILMLAGLVAAALDDENLQPRTRTELERARLLLENLSCAAPQRAEEGHVVDDSHPFIIQQNIELFVRRLEIEDAPNRRSQLRRMLVEEENRFGQLTEQLQMLEDNRQKAARRLEAQRELIKRLAGDGKDTSLARRTLENFEDIARLFDAHRETIVAAMERTAP
ncbi:hypothetical protein [Jiella sp. M17.18]|uniref:hypothetical protein n=1 Tax=Jiella sp. M17.18 TaxID=3234247 RepID=UPI0034DED1A9